MLPNIYKGASVLRVWGQGNTLWSDMINRNIWTIYLLHLPNVRHIHNKHVWNRLIHNRGNHRRLIRIWHFINRCRHIWYIHMPRLNKSPFLSKFNLVKRRFWRRRVQDGWNRSRWGISTISFKMTNMLTFIASIHKQSKLERDVKRMQKSKINIEASRDWMIHIPKNAYAKLVAKNVSFQTLKT